MATRLPAVGMASAVDVGNPKDIHPRDKLTVGNRLALCAKAVAYGQAIVHSGPIFKTHEIVGAEVRISFNHLGGGLRVKGESLGELTI